MRTRKPKYELLNQAREGHEVFGAFYVDGVAVTEHGWWRTSCEDHALALAIHNYESSMPKEQPDEN